MKMSKLAILACAIACTIVTSCKKDAAKEQAQTDAIPEAVLTKIKDAGFSTQNVQRMGDGYLVENDILLHDKDLVGSKTKLSIAKEEQYRTTSVVCVPRVIRVSISGFSGSNWTTAVQQVVNSYNGLGLRLTFSYVGSSGGDIHIQGQCLSGGILGYAGFPSGCNPYSSIVLNSCSSYFSTVCRIKKVLEHEIGHCIGFRHTDWMNRAYSCGSGGSEGQAGVGAIQIPGTPSNPDAGSWMLACASSACTSFNGNDIIALRYLFQ